MDADRVRPALAPAPLRVLVVDGLRLFRARRHIGRREDAVLDGRIDLLDERQRRKAREIERRRRPRQHEARLGHVHVELLAVVPFRAVDDDVDIGLGIARIEAQELPLHRLGLGPVLESA